MIVHGGRLSAARLALVAAVLVGAAGRVQSQETPRRWSPALSAYGYIIPDDADYTIAIGSADYGGLHLEGRWNYENLDAGSFFVGWTFVFGRSLEVEATPMMGVAVGSVFGAVPGLELTVSLGPVEWYTESEYVLDLRDRDDSFFYVWSELGVYPVAPLRVGLLGQRLRVRASPLEIDRGPFAMLTVGRLSIGGYVLNPWSDHWFTIISLGLDF